MIFFSILLLILAFALAIIAWVIANPWPAFKLITIIFVAYCAMVEYNNHNPPSKLYTAHVTVLYRGVEYICKHDDYGRECTSKDGVGLADDEYWKRVSNRRKAGYPY